MDIKVPGLEGFIPQQLRNTPYGENKLKMKLKYVSDRPVPLQVGPAIRLQCAGIHKHSEVVVMDRNIICFP